LLWAKNDDDDDDADDDEEKTSELAIQRLSV